MSDIRESVEGKAEKDLGEIAREKIDSSDEVVSGVSHGYKYSVYEIDDTTRKRYGLTFYDPNIAEFYPVGSFYFHHSDQIIDFLETVKREIIQSEG